MRSGGGRGLSEENRTRKHCCLPLSLTTCHGAASPHCALFLPHGGRYACLTSARWFLPPSGFILPPCLVHTTHRQQQVLGLITGNTLYAPNRGARLQLAQMSRCVQGNEIGRILHGEGEGLLKCPACGGTDLVRRISQVVSLCVVQRQLATN